MKIFVPSQCELFIVPKVKGAHSCHQSALALFYSLAIEKRKIIVKYCQFKYNYINTSGRSVFTQFQVFPISTSVDITVYQCGKMFYFL
jgi:hypothetical protein